MPIGPARLLAAFLGISRAGLLDQMQSAEIPTGPVTAFEKIQIPVGVEVEVG